MANLNVNAAPKDGISDLRRRLDKIEADLRRIRSSSSFLQNATIGRGGLTIADGGSIKVRQPGDLTITDDADNVVWSAHDGPLKAATIQQDNDNLDLTQDAWTEYLVTTVPVPQGFTQAYVLCFASAGVTLTAAGNVGAQALITDVNGPGISNGVTSGPVSVSSFVAGQVTELGPDKSLQVGMQAAQVGGSPQTGTGNVHLSASIVFLR